MRLTHLRKKNTLARNTRRRITLCRRKTHLSPDSPPALMSMKVDPSTCEEQRGQGQRHRVWRQVAQRTAFFLSVEIKPVQKRRMQAASSKRERLCFLGSLACAHGTPLSVSKEDVLPTREKKRIEEMNNDGAYINGKEGGGLNDSILFLAHGRGYSTGHVIRSREDSPGCIYDLRIGAFYTIFSTTTPEFLFPCKSHPAFSYCSIS